MYDFFLVFLFREWYSVLVWLCERNLHKTFDRLSNKTRNNSHNGFDFPLGINHNNSTFFNPQNTSK